MVYKFYCKPENHIVCSEFTVQRSIWHGTGEITFTNIDTLWFGNTHLWTPSVSLQSSEVQQVYTRSSLDEDDEEWLLLWERNGPWSYEGDHELELLLIRKKDGGL